jgi:hypothetical protein
VISRSDPPATRRVPLALVPLVVYVGVTLLAPALNGAGRREGFWEHAAITLGLSGLLSWLWLAGGRRSTPPERVGGDASRMPGTGRRPWAVTDEKAVTTKRV